MQRHRKKQGFTLAELLVIVAIVGILVAVSIPIFTAQLKKARIATVRSNIRAAKTAAYSVFLSDGFKNTGDTHGYYVYTVANGTAALFASMKSATTYANPQLGTVTGSSQNYPKYPNLKSASYQYPYIYVHIKLPGTGTQGKSDIQTCPYYSAVKKDIVYLPGSAYDSGN